MLGRCVYVNALRCYRWGLFHCCICYISQIPQGGQFRRAATSLGCQRGNNRRLTNGYSEVRSSQINNNLQLYCRTCSHFLVTVDHLRNEFLFFLFLHILFVLCSYIFHPKELIIAAEFDPMTQKAVYHIEMGIQRRRKSCCVHWSLPALVSLCAFSNKSWQSDHLMLPPG